MGMSVMSDVTLVPQKSDIWWVFLLQGFAGIIIGLMLITEPGATRVALTTNVKPKRIGARTSLLTLITSP
jgi:uncharacterized membrane protein HdeD (DUF308 family)